MLEHCEKNLSSRLYSFASKILNDLTLFELKL